jgi:hypothetical protein
MLFGQKFANENLMIQAVPARLGSLTDVQTSISDYVFSRGKDKREGRSGHGDVYGSAQIDKESDGSKKTSASVGVKHDFGNGWDVSISAGGSRGEDREGNVKGAAHAKVEIHAGY